ncbi:GDSL-type esterase/lipase family protein [Pontiella sp.]|uniref:GDSL-type esterase/lipase family protein n=1 Tax=Pontiella sp. TaxID=2837462 RepID=UPI00356B3296
MNVRKIFIVALQWACLSAFAADWAGEKSDFHGFDQFDFQTSELQCRVVVPKSVAEGNPWVWRARFWGHEPQVDIALLNEGFHIAYVDVADLFGSPEAVARWDTFYKFLTEEKGFSTRPVLEGMSRGGLIVYNWAAQNPDKISCIYADAPVCDFKSWPGGKGAGEGSSGNWKTCLAAYGLTEDEALVYDRNPIDRLAPLAEAGVPLLQVVGDADTVVPVAENTAIMEQRYKALGGSIEVIHKPGVKHHPHCLKDPAPITAFILKHTRPVRVACVGDSITFGHGIKNREKNSYPAQLALLLGDGYRVENFGVSGATLLKNGNKPYWKTKRFKPAHDFKPDVVIIKLGTNDSKPQNWQYKEAYISDYVALVKEFQALPGHPEVRICYPVPAYPGRWGISDEVVANEIIPMIDQVALQTGAEIIDCYTALSDRPDLFPDTVHPNAEGARLIAEAVAGALR